MRSLLNDVDGFAVDDYAGTFTGTFEVRSADAEYLAYDDEVLIVVRARVKPPRLKEMKNGDITRVNVLAIKEAGVVRSEEMKKHLCDALGLDIPDPQLTFDDLTVEEVVDSPTEAQLESPADAVLRIAAPDLAYFRGELEMQPEVRSTEDVIVSSVKSTKDSRLAAFLSEGMG